jgi:hypothetical protein
MKEFNFDEALKAEIESHSHGSCVTERMEQSYLQAESGSISIGHLL